MRTPHQLTVTIETVHPLPTEDGAPVSGTVEVITECDSAGRASMRCRVIGDDTWHRVAGGSVVLSDPSDLPFHHCATLSRLLARRTPRTGATPESVAFYFCDDLDSPPPRAA